MASRILTRPRTPVAAQLMPRSGIRERKPQGPVKIDRNNKFGRRCLFATLLERGQPKDLYSGVIGAVSGSTWKFNPEVGGYYDSSNGTDRIAFNNLRGSGGFHGWVGQGLTVHFRINPFIFGNSSYVSFGNSSANTLIYGNSNDHLVFVAPSNYYASATPPIAGFQWYTVCINDVTSNTDFYRNGNLLPASTNLNPTTPAFDKVVIANNLNSDFGTPSDVSEVYFFDGAFTKREVWDLLNKPHQFLKPAHNRGFAYISQPEPEPAITQRIIARPRTPVAAQLLRKDTLPQGPGEVDFDNSINQGLVFCTDFGGWDYLYNRPVVKYGGAINKGYPKREKTARSVDENSGGAYVQPPQQFYNELEGTEYFSIVWDCKLDSMAQWGHVWIFPQASSHQSPFRRLVVYRVSTGTAARIEWTTAGTDTTNNATSNSDFLSIDGTWHTYAIVWYDTTLTWYKDGVVFGSIDTTNDINFGWNGRFEPCTVLDRNSGSNGQGSVGDFSFLRIWKRAISPSEVHRLAFSRYSGLKAANDRAFVYPVAAPPAPEIETPLFFGTNF